MLKYVIVDNIKPIIFDTSIQHSDIGGNLNITSAGFIENGKCFGFSDSLNISSKETDSKLISKYLLNFL